MEPLFCCQSIQSYQPRILKHEAKFQAFLAWAKYPRESEPARNNDIASKVEEMNNPPIFQLVKQVNYGALESKRCFMEDKTSSVPEFTELSEADLIEAKYKKLNA